MGQYERKQQRAYNTTTIKPEALTMTAVQLPDVWQRAMERAASDRLHALRLNTRAYAVRSTHLARGTHHIVSLDEHGKIVSCSDCPGWRGRQRPCKHAGCVARRLLREQSKREAG